MSIDDKYRGAGLRGLTTSIRRFIDSRDELLLMNDRTRCAIQGIIASYRENKLRENGRYPWCPQCGREYGILVRFTPGDRQCNVDVSCGCV
jgi:hypothetical protein